MAEFNWKSAALVAAAVLITWLATKGTEIIGTGIEGEIASNPEITALKTELAEVREELDEHKLQATTIQTKAITNIDAIIRHNDQVADRLNDLQSLLQGE